MVSGKEKMFFFVTGAVFLIGQFCFSVSAQSISYDYLIELGREALDKKCYQEALHYFSLAEISSPCPEKALSYINYIKRLREGSIKEAGTGEILSFETSRPEDKKERMAFIRRLRMSTMRLNFSAMPGRPVSRGICMSPSMPLMHRCTHCPKITPSTRGAMTKDGMQFAMLE